MWELIGSCFAGIVTVGILWKMFDHIFALIDGVDNSKVSKDTWDEHCKRMDQLLESGNREFQRMREALQKQSGTLGDMCVDIAEIKTTLGDRKG